MRSRQQQRQQQRRTTINPCWTKLTEGYLHAGIRKGVVALGTVSATYPLTTVVLTCIVSLACLVIGFLTNFQLELNQLHFVTPTNSLPEIHSQWIQNTQHSKSGFPNVRVFYLNLHNHGANVLHYKAMKVALEAMEVLQSTKHYKELCQTCTLCSEEDKIMLFDGTSSYCRISSVTQFWNHSKDVFLSNTLPDDEQVRQVVSHPTYPDGTPVYHEAILGNYQGYNITSGERMDSTTAPPLSLATLLDIYTTEQQNNNNKTNSLSTNNQMYLTSAQCLTIKVDIPDVGKLTDDLEQDALERLADFKDSTTDTIIQVEYFTMNGYQYEMMRALYMDMPLVGVLVVVMVAFAVLVFSNRHNRVQSRGMVGLYSFTTIGLSLWTGYGIMWCIGVPLTTVSILIPFVVSGVGLDDTFIITGTYFRLWRDEKERETQSNELLLYSETTITSSQQKHTTTTLRIVQDTLHEVAVSITMTTITTLLAFGFGATSQIPAVRWLCWYAAISLLVVYLYQITCFIALLVLDERRVQQNRKDLCIWMFVHSDDNDNDKEKPEEEEPREPSSTPQIDSDEEKSTEEDEPYYYRSSSTPETDDGEEKSEEEDEPPEQAPSKPQEVDDGEEKSEEEDDPPEQAPSMPEVVKNESSDTLPTAKTANSSSQPQPSKQLEKSFPERLMGWYADQLLKPISKVIVLLGFALYFGGTVYSTTLLHQEFNIEDYIPDDSYMASSMRAYEAYSTYLMYTEVYFRNVDQSDPEVQLQMMNYVQELSELDQIGDEPGFFWLRDFRQLAESNQTEELIGIDLERLSFNEQVNLALSIPQLRQIYGRDIVRDPESGNITASRTFMFFREFDMYHIPDQIELLMDQRDISLRQPANDRSKLTSVEGFNFFTFAELYFYWELFDTVIDELILNTVLCVVVVSVIAFVLVPHWSAVCYACPLLIVLYFNFMGTMQYCGITINVISYFILVMSIGLLVDFLMHILLRYYESKGATRNEKVKETLETIGASILMGAFTTFLGVIPMAFSTTKIFRMVFICFLAMVLLGCAAGLILLPVLLSLTGPVGDVQHDSTDGEGNENNEIADRKHEKEEIEYDEEISIEYDEEISV